MKQSSNPSERPSWNPSSNPSEQPSANPSSNPWGGPRRNPSSNPSGAPSLKPISNIWSGLEGIQVPIRLGGTKHEAKFQSVGEATPKSSASYVGSIFLLIHRTFLSCPQSNMSTCSQGHRASWHFCSPPFMSYLVRPHFVHLWGQSAMHHKYMCECY